MNVTIFFNFRIPSVAKMDLKWYAIPSMAGMMLEVGGLQFPAAPFNGWYNSIEIVRDLVEDPKYGLLQVLSFMWYSFLQSVSPKNNILFPTNKISPWRSLTHWWQLTNHRFEEISRRGSRWFRFDIELMELTWQKKMFHPFLTFGKDFDVPFYKSQDDPPKIVINILTLQWMFSNWLRILPAMY